MIDVRMRVERLLDTLTVFGRHHEAELFRERFERSNWQLTEEDLAALQTTLTDGLIAAEPIPPEVSSASSARNKDTIPVQRSELPSWLAPLNHHAAYLYELDEALHWYSD